MLPGLRSEHNKCETPPHQTYQYHYHQQTGTLTLPLLLKEGCDVCQEIERLLRGHVVE